MIDPPTMTTEAQREKTNDTLNRVCDIARAKAEELTRAIHRVLDGDTEELVRYVVEAVTEAMENEVCNTRMSEKVSTDLIERMCKAKFETFEQVTGAGFTTISNRVHHKRKADRESTTKGRAGA